MSIGTDFGESFRRESVRRWAMIVRAQSSDRCRSCSAGDGRDARAPRLSAILRR